MIYSNNYLSEQEKCPTIPNQQIQDCLNDGRPIDIAISNVVTSFNLKTHLNLRYLALNGFNVEYKRETGVILLYIIFYLF